MANELKEMQGRLGDLNIAVEKIHTSGDLEELRTQQEALKRSNDVESAKVDAVVDAKTRKENLINDMELLIDAENKRFEDAFKRMVSGSLT